MRQTIRPVRQQVYAVVLVCLEEQWEEVRTQLTGVRPGNGQGREFLSRTYDRRRVVFLRPGIGVVAAAAGTQFAIDRWNPLILMTTVDFDGQSSAIREVADINGAMLLPEPIDSDPLTETMPAAFVFCDELLAQNRTR